MGKRQTRVGIGAGIANFLHAFDSPTNGAAPPNGTPAPVDEARDQTPSSVGSKRPAPTPSNDEVVMKKRRESYGNNETYVDSARKRFDASTLVPRYTDASQVPEHLEKYWSQRYRYFSRFDEGCLLDETGWFSVTPERIADQIADRCRCDTILDAFCGVGGNTIAFAKTCQRVIALDTSATRLAIARHNAEIYGVADHIEFILGDYISFARSYLSRPKKDRTIDVVFLSPPWGGPGYLSAADPGSSTADLAFTTKDVQHPDYSLSSVQPIHGAEVFALTRQITPNVAYFLPRNTSLSEISGLLPAEQPQPSKEEHVEVEEEWMGSKLKALTCYFGGLVAGQEELFDAR